MTKDELAEHIKPMKTRKRDKQEKLGTKIRDDLEDTDCEEEDE